MSRRKKYKNILYVAIGCLILSSLTVIASPYVDIDGTSSQRFLSIAVGILFWISLICGWILWFGLNWKLIKHGSFTKDVKLPGILKFFSTPQARVTDSLFIISIILVLLSAFHMINNRTAEILSVAVLLITFHLHYIFNGKAYIYLTRKQGHLKEQVKGANV